MSIITYKSLDSTSNELRRLIDAGEVHEDFTAVRADFQTAGRGQVGNFWESKANENLLISLVYRPENFDVCNQFIISMSVSLAVLDVVRELLPQSRQSCLKVKWPNDIYVGDKKLAGVLIENRLAGRNISDAIIGIGLNVNQELFESDAPNPVSIINLTGEGNDVSSIAERLVSALRVRLMSITTSSYELIRSEYISCLYWGDGCLHNFRDADGEFSAIIVNVEPDGRFVVIDSDGKERSYLFKEVSFV